MPMLSRLDDPQYCLARAREAQRRAQGAENGRAKVTLLELANDYLRLAKFAVSRRRNSRLGCLTVH
jgi:hypothetical protein